jgi:hypothetical protein
VIQFGRPPNRIDLLSSIDGVTFEEAWDTRLEVEFAGGGNLTVAILSLEKLLQNKRASGRPKDLDDVAFFQRSE